MGFLRRWLLLGLVAAVACLSPSPAAQAMCDVIPGVTQEFRGALGSVNRPFAIPNDDGEEILVRLRPACEPDSTGFADLPGGLAPEDDYFVTVLFEPPGAGARNAVVLGTEANRALCQTVAAGAALPGGGSVTCTSRPFAGLCSGGTNDGGLCEGDAQCPGGTCLAPPGNPDLSIRDECVGGPSAGQACTDAAQCGEGGACLPFRLRFRFPDTDGLVGTPNDDRTLTGPATIAVTAVTDPLPLGLVTLRCADTPGLVACIDELYARDGTCETTPAHVDSTFGHFTALPPPNDYQALCTTQTPGSPCTRLASEARFTVDAVGNALIPMEYRGVLVQADRIPVPRLIQGNTTLPAFSGAADPVAIPSEVFLSSWAPGGQKLPPIFTPIADPTAADALSLFGSVDAPVGVIRVQRRGCVRGADEGRACTQDAECGTGASCATLFEFSDRLAGGVGPVLIARGRDRLRLDAQSPVPLDGLIESQDLFAFVANEAIGERQDDCDGDRVPDCTRLNDDSDQTDPVLRLRDRATGQILPIGTSTVIPGGAEGRAVTRVRDGRFRFPAVAVEGDLVAFLEPEPLEGDCDGSGVDPCDQNGDGDVFDTLLRVYRLADTPTELTAGLPHPLAIDAAPRINRRSVIISDRLVFFRLPEWANAPQRLRTVAFRFELPTHGFGLCSHPPRLDLSADGHFLAFDTVLSDLVPGDTNNDFDVFLYELATGDVERISVGYNESESLCLEPEQTFDRCVFAHEPSISSDGRFVAFSGNHLLPQDANSNVVAGEFLDLRDIYVYDRATRSLSLASLNSEGLQNNANVFSPSLSADGRFVAFSSDADNLVPGDTNDPTNDPDHHGSLDIFLRDRDTGNTSRVSIASDGSQSALGSEQRPSISGDGNTVAFVQFGDELVAEDSNGYPDVLVHDRATAKTELVSVSSEGTQGNHWPGDATLGVSSDGRLVAFVSGASNLAPGDSDSRSDVFVRDRATRQTELASVGSEGRKLVSSPMDLSLSPDGRFVGFDAEVPFTDPRRPRSSIAVHDRITGLTQLTSLVFAPSSGVGEQRGVSVSEEGRYIAFVEREHTTAGRRCGIFVRGPSDVGLADTLLAVFDTRSANPTIEVLGSAGDVAVAAGSAAFLKPEIQTGIDVNQDGDTRDSFVQLSLGGAVPIDLGKEAVALAMSEHILAARVPAVDGGESFAEVCDWRTASPACWRPVGSRATAIDTVGSVVALLAPECPFDTLGDGGCPGGRVLNGDQDTADRVVRIHREAQGDARLIEVGQAAEDFVLGQRLVAFRTREGSQGQDLNRDGDLEDDVLQVFDLVSGRLFNTEQAVTPCPLEACDPRFPYRADGDTVIYITAEVEQGGRDLNGDGDATDLVKQVFNTREAARLLPGGGAAAACTQPIAAASAGICTTTGTACATNAECGTGSCYLPPGGCIASIGTPCRCEKSVCRGCAEGQFCEPSPNGQGQGRCHEDQGACASRADCTDPRAVCRDAAADVQRLLAPTERELVTTSGTCVEPTGAACTNDADCTASDLCGPRGNCERRHGSCVTDADCAEGLRCAPNLVTIAAADSDGDALLDPLDNCPEVANADQADLDRDGVGDACDRMTCGNGVPEFSEECDDGNRGIGDCCSDECGITDQAPPVLTCSATPIRTPGGDDGDRSGRSRDDDDDDDERGRSGRHRGDEDEREDSRGRRGGEEGRERGEREDHRHTGTLRVAFAAGDSCGPVQPESAIDLGCAEVPVSDGQLVTFERSRDCEAERGRRHLELESESAVLRVQATDAAGNSATCTADLAAGGEGIVTAEPSARAGPRLRPAAPPTGQGHRDY